MPTSFHGQVRAARPNDVEAIRAILEHWLPTREDCDHTVAEIQASLAAASYPRYLVAETSAGRVVGVIGMTDQGIDDQLYREPDRPIEMIHAYVEPAHKGTGVGTALANEIETQAKNHGFTRLIVVSGSRNRESGYPFWHRRYGQPARVDPDFFGAGQERVVWSKPISD